MQYTDCINEYFKPKPMTVRDFCLHHTKGRELVAVADPFISQIIWINSENLYFIHPKYADKEVLSTEWSTISITNEKGDRIDVPCHYLKV